MAAAGQCKMTAGEAAGPGTAGAAAGRREPKAESRMPDLDDSSACVCSSQHPALTYPSFSESTDMISQGLSLVLL